MQHEKKENAPAVESNERVSYEATGNINTFLRLILYALQATALIMLSFLVAGSAVMFS